MPISAIIAKTTQQEQEYALEKFSGGKKMFFPLLPAGFGRRLTHQLVLFATHSLSNHHYCFASENQYFRE